MYLFERFHLKQAAFPDLTCPKIWILKKVFVAKGADPDMELSKNTHAKNLKAVLTRLRVYTNKATHINRGSALRMAEYAGVDDNSLRRHGHWETDNMERFYQTNVLIKTLRALAGFRVGRPSFFLERASIVPSNELQMLVWPQLDRWVEAERSERIP